MTPGASIETIEVRLERVTEHLAAGDELFNVGNEWATVAYFYAAYHQMKVAMLEDPVFDDPETLTGIYPYLRQSDREAEHHQGSPKNGGRSMGVTDVVLWVYKPLGVRYKRLHSASIDVRYKTGIALISLESARQDAYTIHDHYNDGTLRHC